MLAWILIHARKSTIGVYELYNLLFIYILEYEFDLLISTDSNRRAISIIYLNI